MARREMTPKELLARAAGKEQDAYLFYRSHAQRADYPGSRELLEDLAKEELKHKEMLEGVDLSGPGRFTTEKLGDARLIDFLDVRSIARDATLQEVLTFAINEEKQAQAFYSALKAYAGDPTVTDLLEQLIRMELGHQTRLEKIYEEAFLPEG